MNRVFRGLKSGQELLKELEFVLQLFKLLGKCCFSQGEVPLPDCARYVGHLLGGHHLGRRCLLIASAGDPSSHGKPSGKSGVFVQSFAGC